MENNLQELTDETLKEVRKLEVVMPEIYKDIFYTKASELNITIKEKDREQAMIYALKKIQKMRNETEESTKQLKTNIKKARTAINQKDETALKDIEIEVEILEKTIAKLQENLYLDELTNIYNRRWLYEIFLKDEKFTENGSFAFIDIDNFKNVNDSYGHLVGDKVLMMIGSLIKKVDDTFAIRFAGDEFILINKKLNKQKLTKILMTIKKNLKTTHLKYRDKTFYITFSFGVADFKENDHFNKIFKKVDSLMYENKET
ncbi:MAG: GGDEF domain-containing protein [Epsilonproteobacteria bacterium]|nr:GGDEF domain-containing protein [Campylobacterota bacterium]